MLRPEAIEALRGCSHIVHAGDIGKASVLEGLSLIAPVTAVRGNNDRSGWARDIPEAAELRVGDFSCLVLHDVNELHLHGDPLPYQAVVVGHSHRPSCLVRRGVWIVNPGSAGPRRFNLPVSVGILHVNGGTLRADLIDLEVAASQRPRS